jgi:hypothetical protein
MTAPPIRVVCDRCRAEGLSGEDPFAAFGALLDFEPVPRRTNRADGWDAEVQRAFIAALSLTGSVRSACRAVGKSAFGADRLLEAEGSEGFRAAWEEAMAIASDERGRRLAEGLRAVAAEQSGWRPLAPPWANANSRAHHEPRRRGRPPGPSTPRFGPPQFDPGEELSEQRRLELLDGIFRNLLMRLRLEREARLAGRICEADFYVRQATFIEVALDLGSDGFDFLRELRARDGTGLLAIAETPMSRLLDDARRAHWAAMGEPVRPEHPRRDRLVDCGDHSTEDREDVLRGDPEVPHQEQVRRQKEHYAKQAAEQVEWEAKARAEAAAWRARLESEGRLEEEGGYGLDDERGYGVDGRND